MLRLRQPVRYYTSSGRSPDASASILQSLTDPEHIARKVSQAQALPRAGHGIGASGHFMLMSH
jgi:hypothetical protein